jgi:hypothetical protein
MERPMEIHGLEEFVGKTVSFGLSTDSYAITDVEIKVIAKKVFLSGKIPKGATTNDAGKGKVCGVSWDSVTDYLLFESEDDYVKWMNESIE